MYTNVGQTEGTKDEKMIRLEIELILDITSNSSKQKILSPLEMIKKINK